MHLVAMKIIGTVFRNEAAPWDYRNNVRPLALGIGGYVTCEVVLRDPDEMITTVPRPAELHFYYVVQFDDGIGEIGLYDGPGNLTMKFRPLSLENPTVPQNDGINAPVAD